MSGIKFCHTADLHLGKDFNLGSDFNEKRKMEVFNSFLSILDTCCKEDLDLLLIAGDLFEGRPSQALLARVKEAFSKAKDLKILISPGNHDYDSIDSCYRTGIWPDNVHIFHSKMSYYDFPDLKCRVFGAGFNSSFVHRAFDEDADWKRLLEESETGEDDRTNILVLHGDLDSAESPYNPIKPENWPKNFFAYAGLGHIHKRSRLFREGRTFYAYSGTPFPLSFNDLGPQGVYIGKIDRDMVRVDFRQIPGPMYLQEELNIDRIRSNRELDEEIHKLLINEDKGPKNYYRLFLTGLRSKDIIPDFRFLEERAKDRGTYLKIIDQTSPELDEEELRKSHSIYAKIILELLEASDRSENPDEREVAKLAINKVLSLSKEVEK